MRALWWFKDNSIAGMARPGFNAVQWRELPFEEGILLSWLGQFSSGPLPIASFRHHLETYGPKVFQFFNMTSESAARALKIFESPLGIEIVFKRLAERTKAFREVSVDDSQVYFLVCGDRLGWELNQLKKLKVDRIVSLTEDHHHRDHLSKNFEAHHFSIPDMNPPKDEHVFELADIIREARKKKEIIAVHCLAGIGRTSTMLIGAHLVLGDSFEEIKSVLAQRNPTFRFLGSQAEFIREFQRKLNQ